MPEFPNFKMPTMGGKQLWSDYRWFHGWKVQKNLVTGHWRLLDPANMRLAWGGREQCLEALQQILSSDERQAPEQVTLLLHGLFRTSRSMASIGKYLEEKGLGEPVSVEYASTRASIADHAQALRELVENIPGTPTINVVGHSMGNIVVRHAVGDWLKDDPRDVLGRFNRMVMLGPPNQGANIARHLGKLKLFGILAGRGGMELGPAWGELHGHLATPPFPFAIVAGRLDSLPISNPLVEGANDFVVSLAEAQLAGAAETLEVPVMHSFLMDDARVHEACYNFLTGKPMK